ncbi:MAG: DUF3604 domain-containing protein [Hungatella sp.]
MNIYWGDIHNHCGITYGYGSLEHALQRAKSHLDFCAVTGHAMWPDMYERTEETAFVVDFHRAGFQKLLDHWDEVRAEIARANGPDFVTFQAYEMHSSHYGDHHIVTPDDKLPLIYRDSPRELVEDSGCDALTVAHHIGYTPGYRGINWDEYDSKITPLVEVCSKHGCAMNETAAYPYYHNMGPRDSRNTVYEGLRRGYHMGFIGSTDHHAGYPGSYGDGKAAVWAKDKTRESIWDALVNRRTYAVTGDRIKCEFDVNGTPMGGITSGDHGVRKIHLAVEACYPIDKIVVYKNLEPIKIIEGLLLKTQKSDTRYKFRIEMGWGNNAEDVFEWNGHVGIKGGMIVEAEPCFRGKSVLAPSTVGGDPHNDINDMDNQMLEINEKEVFWQCYTVKNQTTLHPQTDAVIIEVKGTPETEIFIDINGHCAVKTIAELCQYGYSEHMKPYHSQAFKVHPAIGESAYVVEDTFLDQGSEDADFYHMEVSQLNQQYAYVSPVYFDR